MEVKKCKYCQSEIDKKAKVCPNCKKDVRNWFLRHPILSVILIIIVVAIIGSLSNPNTPETTTTASVKNAENILIAKVGEAIKTDKFEITVTDISEKTKVGNEYLNKEPSEGATFVAVNIKYKNITSNPIGMFDQKPTFKLTGPNNVQYNSDIDASSYYATEVDPNRKVLSDLNPGITVTDSAVFEISKEDYSKDGWKLSISSDKTVEIKIK